MRNVLSGIEYVDELNFRIQKPHTSSEIMSFANNFVSRSEADTSYLDTFCCAKHSIWADKKIKNLVIIAISFFASFFPLQGVIDNRWRDPALNHQVFVSPDPDTCTILVLQPFFESAHHSFDCFGKDTGLFDITQLYTLKGLDDALLATGAIAQSLIPTFWAAALTQGPYFMRGKFQTQGIAFHWYHDISNHWAFGMRGEGLHANARMELVRDDALFDGGLLVNVSNPGNERELTLLQEKLHAALEVQPAIWDDWMLGDFELYARLYSTKPYAYKCRHLDAGIALGLLIPAAPFRDINNPASLPMGGDRHWGLFLEGTLDAIVRHDIRAGFLLRYQQRFSRVDRLRVATAKEPLNFGAVVGDIRVTPGPTVMFAPYLIKENLRDGFGMRVGYTLVQHFRDSFSDCRADRTVPINFDILRNASVWGLDIATLGFLYDFAYDKVERHFEPVISIMVDVPVNFAASSLAAQTFGVAISMEASF